MMNQMNQMEQLNQMSRSQLMHFLNVVSFQVVDTQLFLNTHPDDMDAIEHFNYYRELRQKALKVYEEKYGPLTIDTANPDKYWAWIKEPWPWEGGNC